MLVDVRCTSIKKKHEGLPVVASSNGPPPGAPPGAGAVLNHAVETPAQLQAPEVAAPLSAGAVTYQKTTDDRQL